MYSHLLPALRRALLLLCVLPPLAAHAAGPIERQTMPEEPPALPVEAFPAGFFKNATERSQTGDLEAVKSCALALVEARNRQGFNSIQAEWHLFSGTYTAPELPEGKIGQWGLAVFSDDGCTIVEGLTETPGQMPAGRTLLSNAGKGQTLEKLDQSLHILPIQLHPGQSVDLTLKYSNTLYNKNADDSADIDGITIFAYFVALPVDLDIVHPGTGELSEAEQHDSTKGGLVAVRRGNPAHDMEPITKLVIRATQSMPGLKWKLRFTEGLKFRLLKDRNLTQPVVSDQTEFDSSQEVTLYFEGLKKSSAIGADTVKLMAVIEGQETEAETIYFTVVEAQILVQTRFWIREGWIDVPWHPLDNPLADKIAGGDKRDNTRDLTAGFRVAQEAVLQPLKELNPSTSTYPSLHGIREFSKINKAGQSTLYYKPTSVSYPSLPYSASNPLFPWATPTAIASPSTSRMHISPVPRPNNRTAKVRFHGAANDPLIVGSYDIDWDINVAIDASDPLNLRYSIDGSHDDYPAIEVNMRPDVQRPPLVSTGAYFTTDPQPYFWLHPLPSDVFALGNNTDITISPAKTGDVK